MELSNDRSQNYNVKITILIYQHATDVIKEIDVAVRPDSQNTSTKL